MLTDAINRHPATDPHELARSLDQLRREADEPCSTEATHVEFRQDRFVAAVDRRDSGSFRLAYIVRAVSPGTYHQPAASVQDMYRPDLTAHTDAATVTISP